MLIDLNGIYVESSLVAVVRESALDSGQTVVFTAGQSAMDAGHLIDMPCEEVVERLRQLQMHALAEGLLEDMDREPQQHSQSVSQSVSSED